MSAHFAFSVSFSITASEKFVLDIENNHKFMTSEFKYILYVWELGVGCLPPSFRQHEKWFFPKVQAASTIDDVEKYIFIFRRMSGTERVRRRNWKDVCFSQKWVSFAIIFYRLKIFVRVAGVRHISKHLSENISLSFGLAKLHV